MSRTSPRADTGYLRQRHTVAVRILVVEDEPKMQSLLTEVLSDAGYVVETADDGAAAVSIARAARFDAIVLDVMLPAIDGFEVLELLRRRDDWTPVLMLTARDAVGDRVAGLDGGADDYLVKPFAFSELLSRLRVLLRHGAPSVARALTCGPLTLDPGTRAVTFGDDVIDLSAREFDLLHHLLRNANQVLTRAVIIERVWDHNYDGFSNIVDVNVRNLREKIDRRFSVGLIRTVRGVGYQLVCPPR